MFTKKPSKPLASKTKEKEDSAPLDSLVEEVETPHGQNYNEMSLKELKAEAKEKGLAGYSSMTKNELIEKLSK